MADDKWRGNPQEKSDPPEYAASITPSNDTDMAYACTCINVAATGTVRVTTVGGSTVDLYVAAGIMFPIRARRIHATGTTATGIVASW